MEYLKRSIPRTAQELRSVSEQVAAIIQNVQEKGDRAILEYNTQFDKNTREQFRVTPEEIQAAYAQLTEQEIADLKEAASNIRTFAEAQLQCMKPLDNFSVIPGSSLGHRVIPVSSCGCYVPGGSYPLFSTALMLIIPAKVAGVKRVAACSPAVKGTGYINAKTLVAMDIAGADEIYVTGGAHGIAAYAYGTDQIKPVDVIVGPGNQYVAEAKRQCYGQVGIDFVAGPSECAILADATAKPDWVAADLLAQAEHGSGHERAMLVTDSPALADAVADILPERIRGMSRRATVERVVNRGGILIATAPSLADGMDLVNRFAPEHFELAVENPEEWIPRAKTAGAIFAGHWTPESAGDFAAGPSHVLPTAGTARFFHGITAGDFFCRSSILSFTENALMREVDAIEHFAELEGLDAHGRSASIRRNGGK